MYRTVNHRERRANDEVVPRLGTYDFLLSLDRLQHTGCYPVASSQLSPIRKIRYFRYARFNAFRGIFCVGIQSIKPLRYRWVGISRSFYLQRCLSGVTIQTNVGERVREKYCSYHESAAHTFQETNCARPQEFS